MEGGYQWYYMGYYIHNCVKMRYKGDYKPQMVLDPETYEWLSLDGEFRDALDQRKYVSRRMARKLAEQKRKRKRVDEGDEADQEIENGMIRKGCNKPSVTNDRSNSGNSFKEENVNDDIKDNDETESTQEAIEDEQNMYTISDPEEAADAGLSLLKLRMPGILTTEELESQIDLDHIKIRIRELDVNTKVSGHTGRQL